MNSRTEIRDRALEWVGTPYHHQAYLKGVGADCLGLLRGLYIELYGADPEKPPTYSPAWGESRKDDLLLQAAAKYLTPAPDGVWGVSDVLVFRIRNSASAKHCAIVVGDNKMLHAVSGRAVSVVSINAWADRVAGVFSFPDVKGA